ncbi:MAG: hypothetical protein PVH61_44845 [Candidatus Aminicenantes bacterium]
MIVKRTSEKGNKVDKLSASITLMLCLVVGMVFAFGEESGETFKRKPTPITGENIVKYDPTLTQEISNTIEARNDLNNLEGSDIPGIALPVISNVNAIDINLISAMITWTTDEFANSMVHYGTTTEYGSTRSLSRCVTHHSVRLRGLIPNTLYHYKVVSVDRMGNISESNDHIFTTPTPLQTYVYDIYTEPVKIPYYYQVKATITIKNNLGNLVPNARVSIQWNGKLWGNNSGTTNSNGKVTFTSPSYWGSGNAAIKVTNITHSRMTYNPSLNIEISESI